MYGEMQLRSGEMRLLTKPNSKETLPFRSKRVHQE